MSLRRILNLAPIYLAYTSLIVLQASAQATVDAVLNAETDAFIDKVLSDWGISGGVSVAVVRISDQGTWNVETKGYGVAKADGTKVSEKTMFAIGSNSKHFNVIATGLLIHNETLSPRLSWTSKIASIMPEWELMDPLASNESTIIDLMSHRTGQPRHDFMYRRSDDVPSIISRLKYLRPSAEYRDVWQYCNNMYTTLSYIPSIVLPSRIPFARYVKEHIFDPLGLNYTTYSFDTANATGFLADGMARQIINASDPLGKGIPRALPFWFTEGGEDGNASSGPGGVISNAVDMATWLQTLLLKGHDPRTNVSVIPDDVIEKTATGISVSDNGGGFPELSPTIYGGGQFRSAYRGHEIVEHDGEVTDLSAQNTARFTSTISRLPFDNLGISVMTNDDTYGSPIMEIIKYYLIDEVLGLEKVDWNGRYKDIASQASPPPTSRPANASLPILDFASLAGIYNNPGYGNFELCLVNPSDSTAASDSCNALSSSAPVILPGTIDPTVPTFLSYWNAIWASHIGLTHFNGNIFNIGALTSMPTGNAPEPYWTYGGLTVGAGPVGEFAFDGNKVLGFGATGIWGAGAGVEDPVGKTVQDRAEFWFAKV